MSERSYRWYSTESKPLSEILDRKCSDVNAIFDQEFGGLFSALTRIMDNTYKLCSHHFWILANPHLTYVPQNSSIIVSAVGKNFCSAFFSNIDPQWFIWSCKDIAAPCL